MKPKHLIGLIPFAALAYCIVWVASLLQSVAGQLPR